MRKIMYNILAVLFTALFIISQSALQVSAANTEDASSPIDTWRKCSVNIVYSFEDEKYSGLTAELFQIASADSEAHFTPIGKFADYPIKVNGIASQSEWDTLASTASSYITANNIKPSYTSVTNSNGMASFSNLPCGLYLAGKVLHDDGNTSVVFSPFIIALPNLDEKGTWTYSSDVYTKGVRSIKSSDRVKLHVVKEWMDYGENRPDSVDVGIYCNGELTGSVKLNAKNNWSYEWDADASCEWTVAEKRVPRGYDVVIEQSGTTFYIINVLWEVYDDEHYFNDDDDEDADSGEGSRYDKNIDDDYDDYDDDDDDDDDNDDDDDDDDDDENGSTNNRKDKKGSSSSDELFPDTSDSFNVNVPITIIAGSCIICIVFSIMKKRNEHE